VIDVEAESEAWTERSRELAELLDAGHPVVDRTATEAAGSESRRLGAVAHQARRHAAVLVAAGKDPGCVVGREPPIRRVRTDVRGRDVDPLHGRAIISDELVTYWTHRRDVVAPAVEASYRQAMIDQPYSPALVAAVRGHLAVLRQRRSMTFEGGEELQSSVERYDLAFEQCRMAANDAQSIATEADARLASLRRIAAETELGDRDEVKPLIAAALSNITDLPVDAKTGQPVGISRR
jgi:hypothetical protein